MTETLVRASRSNTSEWEIVGNLDHALEEETAALESDDANQDWVSVGEPDVVASDNEAQQQIVAVLGILLDEWSRVASHQSSIRRAAQDPIYHLILRAGRFAVPELLDRLGREVDPLWIWALGDVTGEDPAAGMLTMAEAAEAWLQWGRAAPR